ncbi:MAG: hypothetical protein HY898_17670 [Deltaproteobacteria bacterium]|nr:hypothetical protein [Deltaproteobacteria bacterium]
MTSNDRKMSGPSTIVLLSAAVVLSAASCCAGAEKALIGTYVAGVRVEADGVARQAPASLPAGVKLRVVLRYDAKYYHRFDSKTEIALLRGSKPVQTLTCTQLGANKDDEETNLTGVVSETGCTVTVPAEGADGLQASFQATPSGSVKFSRLEVALYRKD